MARIEVKYTVLMTQIIDWPDDELEDFNYDNLCANLDVDKSNEGDEFNICDVKKDGKNHDF